MPIKKEITSRADIEQMVNSFYRTALEDEVIGHIFTDVVALNFEKHMPTMFKFWESILLGVASYEGNPMVKHLELNRKFPLEPVHFDRWLLLWESNIQKQFKGSKAEEAIRRAHSIAALMQHKIKQDALH